MLAGLSSVFAAGCAENANKAENKVPQENRQVLTGLDVLERDGFKQLDGKRVGIITNHSSVNLKGENAVDVLYRAKNVKLVKIFSPEHGFRGIANEGVRPGCRL